MRITFPLQKEDYPSNLIKYPDDKNLFSNVEIQGDNIIADYAGTKTFTEYIEPVKPDDSSVNISVYEFRKRFTLDEKVAIKSSTDPVIQVFQDDMNSLTTVNLLDEDLKSGMDYLVSKNILTQSRADEILKVK